MLESNLNLVITHSILHISTEKRFSPSTTIQDLKTRLYRLSGTPPSRMTLELWDDSGERLADLTSCGDTAQLGTFGAYDFCRLHIIDSDPSSLAELNDLSKVDKYIMDDEKYDSLRENYRKWKAGLFGEDSLRKRKTDEEVAEEMYRELDLEDIKSIEIGSRCEVQGTVGEPMRGVVRYVGPTLFAGGYWVGVQLDEPLGKNNGTVKGEEYFKCNDRYGTFVRPLRVKCGDYPEIDLFASDDED